MIDQFIRDIYNSSVIKVINKKSTAKQESDVSVTVSQIAPWAENRCRYWLAVWYVCEQNLEAVKLIQANFDQRLQELEYLALMPSSERDQKLDHIYYQLYTNLLLYSENVQEQNVEDMMLVILYDSHQVLLNETTLMLTAFCSDRERYRDLYYQKLQRVKVETALEKKSNSNAFCSAMIQWIYYGKFPFEDYIKFPEDALQAFSKSISSSNNN